jgi:hypothetical protein
MMSQNRLHRHVSRRVNLRSQRLHLLLVLNNRLSRSNMLCRMIRC